MPNIVKVPAHTWIEWAQKALIADGLEGVKVDRLAKQLGVTRGGFYYHFKNHQDLLDQLLDQWVRSNDFFPPLGPIQNPADAQAAFNALLIHLVSEEDFSPPFEMAVREWARIDQSVKRRTDEVDAKRMDKLFSLFHALGYGEKESNIRAEIFYLHQIGYYSLGRSHHDTIEERLKNGRFYLRILCGRKLAQGQAEERG